MEQGTVETWSDDEAWGVINSPATPGGCWTHFSAVDMDGYRTLAVGTTVDFAFERAAQDGYRFRATTVRVPGVAPATDAIHTDQPGAYSSTLRITLDDGTVLDDAAVDELRRRPL